MNPHIQQDLLETPIKPTLSPQLSSELPTSCSETPQNLDPSTSDSSLSDKDDFEDGKLHEELDENSQKIRKIITRRDKYNVIPNDIRLELVDAVVNRGEKIKRAAFRLGINYSSAKSIFQVFKKEGRADKKSSKKNKLKKGGVMRIRPESNFTNMAFGTRSIPSVELPKLTQPLFNPFDQANNSNDKSLFDIEALAKKIRTNELLSTGPSNGLNFSRNCSTGSEMSQDLSFLKGYNPLSNYFSEMNKGAYSTGESSFAKIQQRKSSDFQSSLGNVLVSTQAPCFTTLFNENKTQGFKLFNQNEKFVMEQQSQMRLMNELRDQQNLLNTLKLLVANQNAYQPEQNFVGGSEYGIPPLKLNINY